MGGDRSWTADIDAAAGGFYGIGVGIEPANRLATAPEYCACPSPSYDFQIAGFFDDANDGLRTPGYEKVDLKAASVSMAPESTEARAMSRSYNACRFNQDSGVIPSA